MTTNLSSAIFFSKDLKNFISVDDTHDFLEIRTNELMTNAIPKPMIILLSVFQESCIVQEEYVLINITILLLKNAASPLSFSPIVIQRLRVNS